MDGRSRQRWVFDRPFYKDRLVWIAALAAAVAVTFEIVRETEFLSWASHALFATFQAAGAILSVGIVGGSIREYTRARRTR